MSELSDAKERAAAQRFAQTIGQQRTAPLAAAEETVLSDILSRVAVWRDHEPEEGETWESWYYAAFDMLLSEIKEIQKTAVKSARLPTARSNTAVSLQPRVFSGFANASGKSVSFQVAVDDAPMPAYADGLRAYHYEIQQGPEGETDFAWVYDEKNNLVCTARTHHADAIVRRMALSALELQIRSAVRVWLACPIEKRPSAQALGQRVAEIAMDSTR